jgi:glycogen debranching enzyme
MEVDAARTKAIKAFQEKFINKTGEGAVVFDAISAAGVPDAAIRPNQLFVLSLLSEAERSRVLEQTTATLGTPYGLLSLDPSHPWFHPFHKYEPVYEQDASYHNGIIWLWNTGEWLSHLISANAVDLAGEVAVNYSQVILNGPALGTLPELADAFPRQPGSSANYPDAQHFASISRLDQMSLRNEAGLPATVPPLSGTFSQAWSLSEYLRNAVEDFGGFKPQDDGALGIVPAIPLAWKKYQVRTYYRGWALTSSFAYENDGWQWRIDASPSRKAQPVSLLLQGPGQKNSLMFFLNRNAETIELVRQGGKVTVKHNGAALNTPANGKNLLRSWTFSSPLRFADFSGFDHKRMNYKSQHTN